MTNIDILYAIGPYCTLLVELLDYLYSTILKEYNDEILRYNTERYDTITVPVPYSRYRRSKVIELQVNGGRVLWYTIDVRYGITLCNTTITNNKHNMYNTVPCRTIIEKYKFDNVPYWIVSHRTDNGMFFI